MNSALAPGLGAEALASLDGEVHVWSALVDDVRALAPANAADRWLDDAERERHVRFRRGEDAELFLLARGLLRHVLSQFADVEPGAWRFRQDPGGRPALDAPFTALPLRFSVSHTPGLVACAVCAGVDVGLDVEGAGRISDISKMAGLVCSPEELRALDRMSPRERNACFHELWTLKEAYVKARGSGLAEPVSHVTFRQDSAGITAQFAHPIDDDPADWQFTAWRPSPGHCGALAVRRGAGPDLRPVFRTGFPPHVGHAGG